LNIFAYTALHYGAEWLEWAIRSVEPMVDRHFIFYTDHPSHGYTTKSSKPETESRSALKGISDSFGNHVIWIDVDQFWQEGAHRDFCVDYLTKQGVDLILWVDADEVWDLDDLAQAIDFTESHDARDYRVHAAHLWKGVNWVCVDDCMPVRLIKPRGVGEAYIPGNGFYHFGYAQAEMTIAYKIKIHGHRAEFRQNWFHTYETWEPGAEFECGVHPTNACDDKTGKSFWTPIPFNRFDIEHLIGDHPYFNDKLI
jgi:hypothetical protein